MNCACHWNPNTCSRTLVSRNRKNPSTAYARKTRISWSENASIQSYSFFSDSCNKKRQSKADGGKNFALVIRSKIATIKCFALNEGLAEEKCVPRSELREIASLWICVQNLSEFESEFFFSSSSFNTFTFFSSSPLHFFRHLLLLFFLLWRDAVGREILLVFLDEHSQLNFPCDQCAWHEAHRECQFSQPSYFFFLFLLFPPPLSPCSPLPPPPGPPLDLFTSAIFPLFPSLNGSTAEGDRLCASSERFLHLTLLIGGGGGGAGRTRKRRSRREKRREERKEKR